MRSSRRAFQVRHTAYERPGLRSLRRAAPSEAQLNAIFGWAHGSQSARYIEAANRKKLAAGWNISVPPKGAGTKRLEMTSEINVEEAGWWALEGSNLQPDGYEPSGNALS
jgi:hypothetical protein